MYPADADTDENFRMMSFEQRGFYWTLLNHAWLNNGLPIATEDIRDLFRVPPKDFDRIWERVSRCFKIVDGRLVNSRQEEERESAKSKSDVRSEAGKLGGKAKAFAKQMPDPSDSVCCDFATPRASESVSESEFEFKKKRMAQ